MLNVLSKLIDYLDRSSNTGIFRRPSLIAFAVQLLSQVRSNDYVFIELGPVKIVSPILTFDHNQSWRGGTLGSCRNLCRRGWDST